MILVGIILACLVFYFFWRAILGIGLIVLGIVLEIAWLGFCFGSVIAVVLMLIFAPKLLLLPMPITFAGLELLLASQTSEKEVI
ncbi:hypothetical protein AGMMS50229_11740 [Campylobacterota bacterium]|nr:hypothetical protein AGMMS50229_11740 [Campylobacterota bacterium]